MRIVIIVTVEETAANFVTGFATWIAGQGHDVTVIASGLERSVHRCGAGSLTYVPVAMERDPSPLQDLRSLVALGRQLRKINPDVLTYATPKAALLASIAGFLLRVPVRMYQVWGLRLETVQGPKRHLLAFLEKVTSVLSTGILANSNSLAERYRERGLNVGRPVDMLGMGSSHGVDIRWFSRDADYPPLNQASAEKLRGTGDALTVGFVGRLHPDKGIDTLLDAARILSQQQVPVNLILIGGDEGAELDLHGGIGQRTTLVGAVVDPRPYYAAMDVLALPSLREGFPNVVLEAAAMSVPAVVSDGTGVVDSVVDEHTGLVVPVSNADALAAAIRRLAEDTPLRVKMGEQARARVVEHFEKHLVWERTLNHLLPPPLVLNTSEEVGEGAHPHDVH